MSRMHLREIIGKPLTGEWGNEDLTGTGVPVLRTTNFTNDGIISFDNVVTRDISPNRLNDKWLKHGDIIIEKSGGSDRQPVGRVVYYVGENNAYTFNNFTSALRVQDQSHWNPKFVFYALFYNYAIGGTRKYENKTTGLHNLKLNLFVDKFAINWISVSEQNRIVAVIDAITHLISLRQRQAEKLDELVKARFVEMFGDPVRNTKQFPLVELQDLYDVSSSKRVYQDEMVLNGIPFLRISDIVEKSTNDKCTPQCFISQEMYDQLSQKGLTPNVGDILVTSRGTLGLCYEVKPGEKFYFQDGMISWLYNRKDCVINTYLLYAFRMPGIRKQIDGSNDGSTVSYLSIARLKRLKIELPPLALQTEFSHFVHEVDREKERIQRSAALLETLKRSLMQQYFG